MGFIKNYYEFKLKYDVCHIYQLNITYVTQLNIDVMNSSTN